MERLPHQRRLDDGTLLDRTQELLAAEVLEPRPESDVRRRWPLRLQRADAFDRARY
jgi:hypothetical protein